MRTNLFYFSSTGNSLIIAKDIAAQLPGTKIFSIPTVIHHEMDLDADNIGFIFPVYFVGMPRIVIDFVNTIAISPSQYLFAICTCGGFPGATLLQAQKQLKTKGIKLNAGFSIRMPGNYIVKYGAHPKEKQQEMFRDEKRQVEAIVTAIQSRQDQTIVRSNFLINAIGNLFYPSMLPKFQTLDRNFHVNEKCNHCHTCEKVCPVQNIKMENGGPVWQGNCEHCLACIQWCPTEAIQYGTQTTNRIRYHHPEVQVKELFR
jgi:ferredoxin